MYIYLFIYYMYVHVQPGHDQRHVIIELKNQTTTNLPEITNREIEPTNSVSCAVPEVLTYNYNTK